MKFVSIRAHYFIGPKDQYFLNVRKLNVTTTILLEVLGLLLIYYHTFFNIIILTAHLNYFGQENGINEKVSL